MSLAGDIGLRLAWDGERITAVQLASTRPLLAPRLFAGKTPAEVLALVPALFSLCGQAQTAAARLALAAAAGAPLTAELAELRHRVVAESLAELFWRLLLDWPQAMGLAANPAPVAIARKIIAAALAAPGLDEALEGPLRASLAELAAEHLFGEPLTHWLARTTPATLADWLAGARTPAAIALRQLRQESPRLGQSAVASLPPADRAWLEAALLPGLAQPGFEQHPRWNGQPAETGALARQIDGPLIAALAATEGQTAALRVLARMTELARLLTGRQPCADWVLGFAPQTGVGVGAVQTARGLLVHRATLTAGRVAEYRIVAPTEWNFDPAGALTQGLLGQPAASAADARRAALILVQSLDPCVACQVELDHA